MNKIFLVIAILCSAAIVLTLVILLNRFKYQELEREQEKALYVEFSATVMNSPIQIEESDEYIIHFSDIEVIKGSTESIAVFNNGGSLITRLPTDNPIVRGRKIRVTLEKNFATTNSIPPQILDKSIIAVQFI